MLLLMQLLSYKQDNVQNDPKLSAKVYSEITALKSIGKFFFLELRNREIFITYKYQSSLISL